MKKILVAIDFSDASRKAAEYAASLAQVFDAQLLLLHAYYIPMPIGDAPGYFPLSMTEVQDENEALLEDEMEYLTGKYPVRVEIFVKMGPAAGVIRDMAAETGADLLVMGMKGAGNSSGIFGSTVTSCIRKTMLPMLVIPAKAEYSPIKHISFAADFLGKAGVARYSILETLTEKTGADIQVVHVQQTGQELSAVEIAGKVQAQNIFSNMKHKFYTVVNTDIEAAVLAFMTEHPTDLLVMVSHHHSLFERIFGTIHTNLVAVRSQVPLLVLHD